MKIFKLLFVTMFFLVSSKTEAKHIFGADLSYKSIAGNTYEVTLTLYGDCSGTPSFTNLYSAIPELIIMDGNTTYATYNMSPFGTPVEVTPVCPAELLNTSCNGGTIPGITQFVFKTTVNLPYAASNWRFVFDGTLGQQGGSAGRSNLISNIIQPTNGNSVMRLEAMLNNLGASNNSASYTTIPTPFFCINIAQQYNQGATDADGDGLTYSMVPALESGGGNVTYALPNTYSQPFSVSGSNFSFNSTSGQMNFTPNLVGNNVVVTKVTETRNGVVIGTTMREMVFVIQNNCNNQSPTGGISSTGGGILLNNSEISLCEGQDTNFVFNVAISDPDSQNVNVQLSGLSNNLVGYVQNNNSKNPSVHVTFHAPQPFTLGDYTFFVTVTDDGCPLSSKQTVAFTVHLVNPFTSAGISSTPESCNPGHDASIVTTATSSNGTPLNYSLNSAPYQTSGIFGNLLAGLYTVTVKDPLGCTTKLPVSIAPSVIPVIDTILVEDMSCHNLNDGSIKLHATSNSTLTYTLYPGNVQNTQGHFTNLTAGIYTIHVSDAFGCTISTMAGIVNPPVMGFISVELQPLFCDKQNGKIIASSNITNGVYFFLEPGIGYSKEGVYENLPANTYTLSVRNGKGCMKDTIVTLGVIPNNFSANIVHQDLPCQGAGNEGSAEVFATGGQPPYSYLWTGRNIAPSSDPILTQLYYGWYFVTTTDAVGCETKDTVYVKPGNCCENIFAADAFTPNGDGNNDIWRIITSTGIEVKHFAIYNRWGDKVWEAEDQRDTWDGRQKNRIVDNGTYYYILRYQCLSDGKNYIKKGEVNVIN